MTKTILILSLFPLFFTACLGTTDSNPDSEPFLWPSSTLAAENVDEAKINEMFTTFIDNDSLKWIRSFTLIRNGRVAMQKYLHVYSIDTSYYLASTTKCILSLLVGMAIQEGFLPMGVESKVLSFFADKTVANLTPDKQNITLSHLLTLKDGISWDNDDDPIFNIKDPLQYILDKPMSGPPGGSWNYTTSAPHLISHVLTRATGMTTQEYARTRLFEPLDITTWDWELDRTDIAFGAFGLWLKPDDLAKIGVLFVNQGAWEGEQIIDKEWIEQSTEPLTDTQWPENGKMGYFWWVNDFGGYCSRGAFGQNMYVLPEKNAVVVFTAGLPIESADRSLNFLMKNYIIPALN